MSERASVRLRLTLFGILGTALLLVGLGLVVGRAEEPAATDTPVVATNTSVEGVTFVPLERWPQLPRPGGSYEQVAHLMTREVFEEFEPVQQWLLARLAIDTYERYKALPPDADVSEIFPERPAICWAPGTKTTRPTAWLAGAGGPQTVLAGTPSRWTATLSDGGGLVQGQPTTLTWGIVPDGTTINAEPSIPTPAGPSTLIASLDFEYGDPPGPYPPVGQSWFPLIQGTFTVWSALIGTSYVFEPNDDGANMGQGGAAGVLGTRAEVRLGSYPVDGNSGILAFNYFPNNGDMVYDALDFSLAGGPGAFFANLASTSIRLRNVTSHEHGHGLGMSHVCPLQTLWLMEPIYTGAFDGPQLDDILTGQRGYGDSLEDDDGSGAATNLGVFGAPTTVNVGTLFVLTVDGLVDNDWFVFTTTVPFNIGASVIPDPTAPYLQDPQPPGPGPACNPPSGATYNPLNQCDLDLEIYDITLTSIGYADGFFPGATETIAPIPSLPAGTYYVRAGQAPAWAIDAVQQYVLQIDLQATVTVSCPADQTLECNVPGGGWGGILGTWTVNDPAGLYPLAFELRYNGGPWMPAGSAAGPGGWSIIFNGGSPFVPPIPFGTTVIDTRVTNTAGASATCSFTVNVVDTQPPTVTASVVRTLYWPPRGMMLPPGYTYTATDTCQGPAGLSNFLGVWSDEPNGAAPYTPDAMYTAFGLLLRAERDFTQDGRVYQIRLRSNDGTSETLDFQYVGVPHTPTFAGINSVLAQMAAAGTTLLGNNIMAEVAVP